MSRKIFSGVCNPLSYATVIGPFGRLVHLKKFRIPVLWAVLRYGLVSRFWTMGHERFFEDV